MGTDSYFNNEQIQIGVGFEQKSLILYVYVLFSIYLYLTHDPNDPDEPYTGVIILISPI